MSLYTDGAMVGSESKPAPKPVVLVTKEKASDNFWTGVKWVGAALVLVTGYREAREWWRGKLYHQEQEREEDDES